MAAELRIEVSTAEDLDRLRTGLDRLLLEGGVGRTTSVDVHVAARELVMFGLTRDGAPSVDVSASISDGEVVLLVEHESSSGDTIGRLGAASILQGGGRGALVFRSVTSHQGYVRRGESRGTALVFAAPLRAALAAS